MWFKNIYIFAFTKACTLTKIQLEALVAENTFTPLGSTEVSHFGWVNALGKHGDSLCHEAGDNLLLCARKEEKILPASVVADMLEERINTAEVEFGRGITRKEQQQMKDDLITELLPRAFNRITDTHVYINPVDNIVVVNASSRGKAEDVLALLRKSIGTLPVTSVDPDSSPDDVMTEWLTLNIDDTDSFESEKFTLGMEAEFNSLGKDSAVVRVKNQDLASEEVGAHLDADKFVTKVALEYDDSMSFILTDDLSIKRIKFKYSITEHNDGINLDDVRAVLDADFTLMAGELNRMIQDLFAEFGVNTRDTLED